MSRPRTIAIGDIHGCATALSALLDVIQPSEGDKLVLLGDYVDRGSDSRGVIERVIALHDECIVVPLIGNHEVMLLDALDQGGERLDWWLDCGGRATLASYGGTLRGFPAAHDEFLRALHDYHETESDAFVHANYHENYNFQDQPRALTLWQHLTNREPLPHRSGKTVFVGHTPQRSGEILDLGHVVCIDTACVMGGWLTAIDVETRDVWQADSDGNLRE